MLDEPSQNLWKNTYHFLITFLYLYDLETLTILRDGDDFFKYHGNVKVLSSCLDADR